MSRCLPPIHGVFTKEPVPIGSVIRWCVSGVFKGVQLDSNRRLVDINPSCKLCNEIWDITS